ncbi:orotate phosphoribosyltransferase [bacterium]|nr:orotate phosphoribosyltransferase [bacterium]
MNAYQKNKILKTLAEKALKIAKEGELFSLASGKKSKYYLDGKIITMNPSLLEITANLLIQKINDQKIEINAIGGLTLGADPLAYAISLEAKSKDLNWLPFVVRKEKKDRGTGKQIEGLLDKNSNVIVLEDVTTTGSSALKAVEAMEDNGHNVIAILTMVDREEGSTHLFEKNKIPLMRLFTLSELVKARTQPR